VVRRSAIPVLVALAALVALPAPAGATSAVEQLPGGKYAGPVGGKKKVKLRVAASGARGAVRVPCAGVRSRFRIGDDGSFRARKRNRRGKVVLRVRGRFANLSLARGRVAKLRRGGPRCSRGRFRAKLRNVRGLKRTTVRYGPYHVDPSHGDHGAGGNVGRNDVAKPCADCYIVAMRPELVDPSGAAVNYASGAMLHHMVFINQAREDATCNGPVLGRERFFAAGNERTMFALPAGYGYRVDSGDTWLTIAHLMNMGHEPRELGVEVTFWYVEAPAPLRAAKPFWFDINNCGNSEYTTPAGLHTAEWELTIPPELSGRVLTVGGHLHDHGVAIALSNETRGDTVCRSVAGYGSDPAYAGHIESMTGCSGDPLATFRTGDQIRVRSTYDSPVEQDDVMGIMLGYVAPGGSSPRRAYAPRS